jgi:hypothetical protein
VARTERFMGLKDGIYVLGRRFFGHYMSCLGTRTQRRCATHVDQGPRSSMVNSSPELRRAEQMAATWIDRN